MAILDAHGNPVDLKALRQEVAAPTLTGVRQVVGDHPTRGLTPARLAQLLLQSEQGDAMAYLALAEDMEEKDLNYRAQLQTRKLACAGLPLVVEAASDDKGDQAAADLVREALAREDLEDVLADILDSLGKGFSVSEILWDTEGRRWMPREILWRDPRWFSFDPADGRTLRLRELGGFVPLQPYKFILHKPKLKSGLPIRGGLARAAAWSWLFANVGLKDWVAFAELFGQPLRLGKYPTGATAEQIEVLEQAVRGIGSDAAAVIPDGMVIDFVEATVKGGADVYERLLRYLDERVTLAVLGQTLTSGQTKGGGGSLALGQVHNEVRQDLMRADARQLAATLNRDLVRPLVDLNLGPQARYPKVRLWIRESEDLPGLVTALQTLVPMGLRVSTSVVRDKLGLPDAGEGEEILAAPKAAPAPPTSTPAAAAQSRRAGRVGECRHCGSAHAQGPGDTDALDGLVDLGLGDWVPQFRPIAQPLIDAVQGASSLEDAQARVEAALKGMDPSLLASRLAETAFMARAGADAGVNAEGDVPKDAPKA